MITNSYLKLVDSKLIAEYHKIKRMVELTAFTSKNLRHQYEFKLGQIKSAMDKRGLAYDCEVQRET